jgi:hypothetical protein
MIKIIPCECDAVSNMTPAAVMETRREFRGPSLLFDYTSYLTETLLFRRNSIDVTLSKAVKSGKRAVSGMLI